MDREVEWNDTTDELTPAMLESVKARMHQQLMQEFKAAPVIPIKWGVRVRKYVAAAAIIITVGAGSLLWFLKGRQGTATEQSATALSVIENDRNVVRKVTMPDGTIVWLNRNSRLEFDHQQYNQKQRYVKLSGEGYFEVTKDASRPFVVETGNMHTRVLGTAFNIEAYHQESEIRISLVHGKIALEDKAKSDHNSAGALPKRCAIHGKQKTGNYYPWLSTISVHGPQAPWSLMKCRWKKRWNELAAGTTWPSITTKNSYAINGSQPFLL